MIAGLPGDRPIVLDGAWGTELQARGLAIDDLPDTWNLEHPGRVASVASAYVDAGADVILTNTFRANRLALAAHGVRGPVLEINRAGVAISRRAAGTRAKVFGSIGPSGRLLLAGDTTAEDLRAAFGEQAEALRDGGADALVVETMTDVAEAVIAVAAAKRTGLPVVASVVFDSGKRKDRTMMGDTPERAAAALAEAGADVIGANCGAGVAGYVEICARLRAATDRPIWIKANAGIPTLVGDRPVWPIGPDEFAIYGPRFVEAGATFVGGCCGTTPETIRQLAAALRR